MIFPTLAKSIWKYFFVILIIVISSCGPDSAFKNAIEERSEEKFEDFIEDYPESELVPKAKENILDIRYWEQIKDTLKPDSYSKYLKEYPVGLFADESILRLNDLTKYYSARDLDVASAFEDYLKTYPSGIFKDYANERIEKLKTIEPSFEQLRNTPSTENLYSFISSNEPSGYKKIAYQMLDSITGFTIYQSFLQKYRSLPQSYKDLLSEIEKTGNNKFRQVREEYLVQLINSTGKNYRPSIPGSDDLVYGKAKSKFSVNIAFSIKEDKVSAKLSGTGNQRMTFQQRTNDLNLGDYVLFTEFKNDLFHVKLNLASTMLSYLKDMTFTARDGSIIAVSIPYSINCGDGSILRFYGRAYVEGMLIKNSGSDPLTFLLDSEYGWIYLYGNGIVTTNNGEEINF